MEAGPDPPVDQPPHRESLNPPGLRASTPGSLHSKQAAAALQAAPPVSTERRECLVYQMIVRRIGLRAFQSLNRGDTARMLDNMTSDVVHYFPGDHTLGGRRTNKADVTRWFARLTTLFPGLHFTVEGVASRGWPWDTMLAVEWTSHGPLPDGSSYDNLGTHVIRLRWGKVVSFHAYMDSQTTAAALLRIAATGVSEATAPQIVSAGH